MRKPVETQSNRLLTSDSERISLHISLRYIKDENYRWKLHIIVDEMTTAAELRKAWGKIDTAREELKLLQGTDPIWYSVALMLDLEEKKKESSFSELAMDMNFDALVFLLWAVDKRKGEKFAKIGWLTFIIHLQGLGIKNHAIQKFEKEGIASLAKGNLPWKLKEGPISSRRITDALRQFEFEKKSKKVVITKSASTYQVFNLRIAALVSKYWIQAKDLFNRLDPEGYRSYEKRWNARTSELIHKNSEFSGLNPQ